MNYPDAVDFLFRLQQFGMRPGLETATQLAALVGDPQKKLRFIHVAGTNGKGSTCAFLESIYRHAGLKVGLYTSPHLVSFCERIQVNRRLVTEHEVARLVTELAPLVEGFPAETFPTFFEVVTVMALRHFAEQKCDVVIWETGLGGRLDATNIVTPLASVITNIALDHTQWLGETLTKIAGEKAGIIKPGVPVIIAEKNPEPLQVIEDRARSLGSPVTLVYDGDAPTELARSVPLPLLGEHQMMNAALALATVDALQTAIPVARATVEEGLIGTRWAGRLQFERIAHGRTVLLDGAHNPAGAQSLRAALEKHFPKQKPALITGVLADKDWPAIARTLAPVAGKIFVVPLAGQRALPPAEMAAAFRRENPSAEIYECTSLADALTQTVGESFLLITGSLYLIGEAMEQLGFATGRSERRLNEYGVKK
ncbi:MAG: bifunctional folylpolyglutamate synthase/dihydrofolate synthase [Verrucomicrobia bacterium]|nr:bifunctional folylpolyglutamate synthase/dihydrofolate synthase [Verrucomicrobiota bacterium]